MENQSVSLEHTNFRYLHDDEIADPLYYISAFCEAETDLYYFREDILGFLKSGFAHHMVGPAGQNPYFADTQQELIRMIELLYVVYAGGIDIRLPTDHPYSQNTQIPFIDRLKTGCALTRTDFLYRSLTTDEMVDIRNFLGRFFSFKTLDEWRQLLDELLSSAYLAEVGGVMTYPSSIFTVIELVEKLAEAFFWVNHVQVWKANRQQSSKTTNMSDGAVFPLASITTMEEDQAGEVAKQVHPGLSVKLERAVVNYFKMIDPGFASNCLRKILLDALALNLRQHTFTNETHGDSFLYPFQELFILFDIAKRETADWSQDRIGNGVIFEVW